MQSLLRKRMSSLKSKTRHPKLLQDYKNAGHYVHDLNVSYSLPKISQCRITYTVVKSRKSYELLSTVAKSLIAFISRSNCDIEGSGRRSKSSSNSSFGSIGDVGGVVNWCDWTDDLDGESVIFKGLGWYVCFRSCTDSRERGRWSPGDSGGVCAGSSDSCRRRFIEATSPAYDVVSVKVFSSASSWYGLDWGSKLNGSVDAFTGSLKFCVWADSYDS